MPGFTFAPEPAFKEFRVLFSEEARLLDEDWNDSNVAAQHHAIAEQIVSLGLTLRDENGWKLTEFALHIDADNHAWFRL